MIKRPVIIVGGLLGLVVFAAVVWWLASPLFIDNTIDEAFPFEVPSAAEVSAMSAEERMAVETEFMAAVPDETELSQLSEADRAKVEEMVLAAAATVMPDKNMEEPMPEAPAEWIVVRQGSFVDADSFHQGSGTATIYQQGEEQVLRFETFTVTNGPDLHVILTNHPAPASRSDVGEDYIDLGPLKGNQGNQNYEIPAGTDLSQYQSVVIYCVPFHVIFATATLNP
jgi:hypothetical protein